MVRLEPARLDQFVEVDANFARRVFGREGEHERVGEGPGLTGEITEVADLQADLLPDFAHGGFLEGFARLDESGDDAEEAGGEMAGAGQQDLVPAGDADDDGGGDPGEDQQPAGGALLGPLGWPGGHRLPAPAAELVGAVPIDDLHRAAGQPEELIRQSAEGRAQTDPVETGGRRGVGGHLGGVAGLCAAPAQELAAEGEEMGERKIRREGKTRFHRVSRAEQEIVSAKDEPQRGLVARRRRLNGGVKHHPPIQPCRRVKGDAFRARIASPRKTGLRHIAERGKKARTGPGYGAHHFPLASILLLDY